MKPIPIITQVWEHSEPPAHMLACDLQLLTICGISVLGRWCGNMGEFFVGWAPLLGASRSQVQGYEDYKLLEDLDLCPQLDVQPVFN